MQLDWRRCQHGTWCAFDTVVLPDANASGILIIWSGCVEHIIFVGQGGIAKGIKWARQFQPIVAHGNLFVTWATVPENSQNGLRNYFLQMLSPLHSDRPAPDAPIPANLPWEST